MQLLVKKTAYRKTWFFLIITLFTLIIPFTIIESTLRWALPQVTYSRLLESVGEQYTSCDFIPFTLKSNYQAKSPSQEYPGKYVTVSTNSLGLRGGEVSLTKPKGTKRILVLGDSYTFGVYVENEQAYPAVVETLLRGDGHRVEVVNAGYADGWEPDEHYAWLVNRGIQFQPDLIVYGFFIGNDISGISASCWVEFDKRNLPTRIVDDSIYVDSLGRIRSKVADQYTVAVEKVYRFPVLRESHFVILLSTRISRLFTQLARPTNPNRGWGNNPFPYILKSKSDAAMLDKEHLFLKLVKGMSSVANESGAQFMVLMLPVNFQVEPHFLPKVLGSNKFCIQRNYFAELKPKLDAMEVAYLDMLEKMTSIPGRYYPRNGEVHFNPEGHRFTAEQIVQFLDRNGFP